MATTTPVVTGDDIPAPPAGRARVRRRKRLNLTPYYLLAPALVVLVGLLAYPMVRMFWMSLHEVGLREIRGTRPAKWVGLANYKTIFGDELFWQVLRNTVLFAAVNVALTLIIGTLVGLLLNRLSRRMAVITSGFMMLGWATPPISGAIIWRWLFGDTGGLVNWLLDRLPDGLSQAVFGRAEWADYSWFNNTLPAYFVLTLCVVWQSFPFVAVSVLAGLKSVPQELLEAARVDGASAWRTFWSVTFPLLRPIFAVLAVLSTIWDFKVFTQQFIITGTANRDAFMLAFYGYATAFRPPAQFGLGSAIAIVLTVIMLIFTGAYVRMLLKQESEAVS